MHGRIGRGKPGLFGDENRRLILAALVDGPLHIRALSRASGVGYRSTWHIVERMVRIGAVAKIRPRDRTTFAMLDRSFPAASELRALLCRLGDDAPPVAVERERHHLWGAPKPHDANAADHHALFGSRLRGAILTLVAHMEAATATDMQSALGISEQMVRLSLDTLVDAGVLAREPGRIRNTYRLRDRMRGAAELRALLLRMGRSQRALRAVANARVRDFAPQVRRQSPPVKRAVAAEDRLPFLEEAHARMLLALVAGPRTVKEMAEAFAVTPATVRATANRLEQTGALRVERTRRSTAASLDPAYPAHAELVALLCAANARNAKVVPLPLAAATRVPRFGNDRMVRVLTALAHGGAMTADAVANAANARGGSAKRVLHLLARRRIVEIVEGDRYRLASTSIGRATGALAKRFA